MYVCKKRCYHKGRLWREGQIAEDWQVDHKNKHFEPLTRAVKTAEHYQQRTRYLQFLRESGLTEKEASVITKDVENIEDKIEVIKKSVQRKLKDAQSKG